MNHLKKLKRSKQVAEVLLKYGLDDLFGQGSLGHWLPQPLVAKLTCSREMRRRPLAQRLRLALTELGTTYVKLGQMLSDRADLLPADIIAELRQLQDRVQIQPIDMTETLARELNIVAADEFAVLETVPMASASIAQVFSGSLKNGQHIVLKIKRENIEDAIDADLLVLRDLAHFLERHHETFRKIRVMRLWQAFEESLREELSFSHERRNLERFARNFREDKRICVPKVHGHLCSDNVLCMDFIDGIKVNENNKLEKFGLSPKAVAELGLSLYVKQVLEHGFFHADPHAGNILLLPDGRIAFIDMGAMGVLLPQERELLEDFVLHFSQKNVNKMLETVKLLAEDYESADERRLAKELYEIMDLLDATDLRDIGMGKLLQKIMAVFSDNQILLPDGFMLLVKGLAQIEGIGRQLYPDLNILEMIQPYAAQVVARRWSPQKLLRDQVGKLSDSYENWLALPEEMKTFLQKIRNKEIKLEHEVEGLERLRQTFERLGQMLVVSALIIGSAILSLDTHLPKLFGVSWLAFVGFVVAGVLGVRLIWRRNK